MTKTALAGSNVHKLQFLHRDRGYRFSERDPAMIELCSLIHDSELSVEAIVQIVSGATGGAYNVGSSTIYNWLNGKTRRPQSFTMNWVGFALGYERKWTKMR
jgi:IS30 family transposase